MELCVAFGSILLVVSGLPKRSLLQTQPPAFFLIEIE
jgi:hypothetical protein